MFGTVVVKQISGDLSGIINNEKQVRTESSTKHR